MQPLEYMNEPEKIELPKVMTFTHSEAMELGFAEHSICNDVALLPKLQADLKAGGCKEVCFSQIPKTPDFTVWVKMD